nr:hypothetical protein [Tanacetum cinerariifolium]
LTNKSRKNNVSYPRFISCALEVLLGSNYTQDEKLRSPLTILSNSNFSKDPSKVNPIELTASMIDVNNRETSVSPFPFSVKKKKVKSQTVTSTLPKSQGPEALGILFKKRNKPKSKKTTPETQVTPPVCQQRILRKPNQAAIKGYYKENVDHRDQTNKLDKETMKTIDNISKARIDERTKLLKALNRVSKTLDADSALKEEMKHMAESHNTTSGNLSMAMPFPLSALGATGRLLGSSGGVMSITGPDDDLMILVLGLETRNSRVILVSGGLEENLINLFSRLGLVIGIIFDIGITLDALASSSLTVSVPTSSGFFIVVTICIGSPLVAAIKGYYKENVDRRDQTNKLDKETMKTIDNISKARIDERTKLLKALNRVSKTLDADSALKEEMKQMAESHNTTSGNFSSFTELLNNAKLLEILTKMDVFQSTLNTLITTIKKPKDVGTETVKEELASASKAIPISNVILITRPNLENRLIQFSSRPPLTNTTLEFLVSKPKTEIIRSSSGPVIDMTPPEEPESLPVAPKADRGKGIATDDIQEPTRKLVPTLREVHKEEKIKKVAKEVKLLAMSKPELIKVVDKEASNVRIDPKVKRQMKLRKKRLKQYMWTTSNRLKPEPIIDVKIHLNIKPVVLAVYRGNDRRNFDVHNPFKFADFRDTELDELGPIIEKKKNRIVGVLMISLGKRYERLKKIHKDLGIQSAHPAHAQA